MEMFTKVQHHKKWEICLTFHFRNIKKKSFDKNMNVLKYVFINFIFTKLEFCVWHIQRRNEGGQGAHSSPAVESLWGRRMTAGGAGKSNNVTSTFFNSTFASETPQVRTRGRQTCILHWAPSNLVTPLGASHYALDSIATINNLGTWSCTLLCKLTSTMSYNNKFVLETSTFFISIVLFLPVWCHPRVVWVFYLNKTGDSVVVVCVVT